jgi:DNA-directed RNA polymerase subunit M/transcription elongation factor TFIIS
MLNDMSSIVEYYIPKRERENTVARFKQIFKNNDDCIKIEKGIYNYAEEFCNSKGLDIVMGCGIYKDCTQNLLFNFEQEFKSAQKLIKEVNRGKYNPYNLAFLSAQELNEDGWKRHIERKKKTEEMLKEKASMEWRKCNCGNTHYYWKQEQTRSADEAMTVTYECTNCGEKTKINN